MPIMHKPMPSKAHLDECFAYDGERLIWKHRPRNHFASHRSWAMWNAKFAGSVAGRTMLSGKHRQIGIDGFRYLEHRIIAAMVGISTDSLIDHVDGNGLNNRKDNLRPASVAQNSRNNIGWKNRDLPTGVYRSKTGRFTAAIRRHGKQCHLGTFATAEAARKARVAAEAIYYGEFSAALSR